MIILKRKRIVFILSMVLVSMSIFMFQVADKEVTIETVGLPVSNKVIVIDAGHGKPDERCRK